MDDLFCSFVEDININTVSENERENCEGLLSQGELLQAQKIMEPMQ